MNLIKIIEGIINLKVIIGDKNGDFAKSGGDKDVDKSIVRWRCRRLSTERSRCSLAGRGWLSTSTERLSREQSSKESVTNQRAVLARFVCRERRKEKVELVEISSSSIFSFRVCVREILLNRSFRFEKRLEAEKASLCLI